MISNSQAGFCSMLYLFSRHYTSLFTSIFVWFGLDKCQVPTKTTLSLSWTGERKYGERLVGRDKDRERSLINCCNGQNRQNVGRKGSLVYDKSDHSRVVRNNTRS